MCFYAFTPFRLSTRHHYTRAPDYCAAQLAWLINHAVMHLQRPIANQTGRTLHKFKANAYRAVTEPPAFTAHELAYRQCEVVCCKWNVPRSQLGALTPHRASDDSIFDWAVNGLSMSSVNTYITHVCVCVLYTRISGHECKHLHNAVNSTSAARRKSENKCAQSAKAALRPLSRTNA